MLSFLENGKPYEKISTETIIVSEGLETTYFNKNEDRRKIIEDQEDLFPGIA